MPAPRSEGAPSRSVPRPGVEQSFSDFKSNWGEVPGANPKNVRSHLAPHINRMEDTIATLVGNLGELSDAGGGCPSTEPTEVWLEAEDELSGGRASSPDAADPSVPDAAENPNLVN